MSKSSSRGWGAMRWLAVPVIGLVLAAGLSYGPAEAGVVNSKHDFSLSGTGGLWGSSTEDEVCVFCHTPHNAQPSLEPLWNREDRTVTYALYDSSTLTASPTQPAGASRLCLSCHDGAVAIDAYVSGGATPTMMALGDVYYPGSPYGEAGANIGGNYTGNSGVNNLMNDHPISFDYDATLVAADGGLNDPATIAMPLPAGKLECSTCHDVHNQDVAAGSKLLRVTQTGSQICLRCHAK